jgi:hypothetical protein
MLVSCVTGIRGDRLGREPLAYRVRLPTFQLSRTDQGGIVVLRQVYRYPRCHPPSSKHHDLLQSCQTSGSCIVLHCSPSFLPINIKPRTGPLLVDGRRATCASPTDSELQSPAKLVVLVLLLVVDLQRVYPRSGLARLDLSPSTRRQDAPNTQHGPYSLARHLHAHHPPNQ